VVKVGGFASGQQRLFLQRSTAFLVVLGEEVDPLRGPFTAVLGQRYLELGGSLVAELLLEGDAENDRGMQCDCQQQREAKAVVAVAVVKPPIVERDIVASCCNHRVSPALPVCR